jgi:hypothetical protein
MTFVSTFDWTRQGIDGFLGHDTCQGQTSRLRARRQQALILMGVWCGAETADTTPTKTGMRLRPQVGVGFAEQNATKKLSNVVARRLLPLDKSLLYGCISSPRGFQSGSACHACCRLQPCLLHSWCCRWFCPFRLSRPRWRPPGTIASDGATAARSKRVACWTSAGVSTSNQNRSPMSTARILSAAIIRRTPPVKVPSPVALTLSRALKSAC